MQDMIQWEKYVAEAAIMCTQPPPRSWDDDCGVPETVRNCITTSYVNVVYSEWCDLLMWKLPNVSSGH